MRHLLDDKRPLAEFLDEHCGWVLVNLVEAKADTVGEWCDIITELAPWRGELEEFLVSKRSIEAAAV